VSDMTDILIYIITAIGGAIAGILYYVFKKRRDPVLVNVLEYLTRYHLDERVFSIDKVAEGTQLPKEVVERAIVRLEKAGIVVKTKRGYELVDPLVFLTPRDYEKALRLTKGDNIIYGAYQMPYVTDIKYIALQIVLLIGAFIFVLATLFVPVVSDFVRTKTGVEPPVVFSLFVFAIAVILIDVIDNLEKFWIRERYSVVVGMYSGILYDMKVPDELSGRIPRGGIVRADVDMNWRHKIKNLFGETPIGDVKVWVRNREEPIVFRSMPYPRELFMVIRALQLGSLEWRKKYARELALWRGRVYPFVPSYRRRGRRGRR